MCVCVCVFVCVVYLEVKIFGLGILYFFKLLILHWGIGD